MASCYTHTDRPAHLVGESYSKLTDRLHTYRTPLCDECAADWPGLVEPVERVRARIEANIRAMFDEASAAPLYVHERAKKGEGS